MTLPPFPRVEKGPGIGADGWHAIDPVIQFASPYVGMGNNPVIGIDPDDFRCSMLEGLRTKIYVNGGVEFYLAGLGVSWSIPIGLSGVITGVSYQVSIGLSIFGHLGIGIK